MAPAKRFVVAGLVVPGWPGSAPPGIAEPFAGGGRVEPARSGSVPTVAGLVEPGRPGSATPATARPSPLVAPTGPGWAGRAPPAAAKPFPATGLVGPGTGARKIGIRAAGAAATERITTAPCPWQMATPASGVRDAAGEARPFPPPGDRHPSRGSPPIPGRAAASSAAPGCGAAPLVARAPSPGLAVDAVAPRSAETFSNGTTATPSRFGCATDWPAREA